MLPFWILKHFDWLIHDNMEFVLFLCEEKLSLAVCQYMINMIFWLIRLSGKLWTWTFGYYLLAWIKYIPAIFLNFVSYDVCIFWLTDLVPILFFLLCSWKHTLYFRRALHFQLMMENFGWLVCLFEKFGWLSM